MKKEDWTPYVATYVRRYCPKVRDWQIAAIAGNLEQVAKRIFVEAEKQAWLQRERCFSCGKRVKLHQNLSNICSNICGKCWEEQ